MDKSIKWLWKRTWKSFVEVGVPICPEDIAEPRWANLLFGGAICHVSALSIFIGQNACIVYELRKLDALTVVRCLEGHYDRLCFAA